MVSCPSQISWPPFCRLWIRCVNNEFISGLIVYCLSLKALHIWTMSELGLCITAQNIAWFNQRHPLLFLFFGAANINCRVEHGPMIIKRCDTFMKIDPLVLQMIWIEVKLSSVRHFEPHIVQFFKPKKLLFSPIKFVVFGCVSHLRMVYHVLSNLLDKLLIAFRTVSSAKLVLIKVVIGPFL